MIACYPEYRYEAARIGGMDGLKGKHPKTGEEWWMVFGPGRHYDGAGPWDEDRVKEAALFLSTGVARVERRQLLKRPMNGIVAH